VSDPIPVHLAVNDDHGNVSDRVSALHVPGLELSAIDVAGVHFRALPLYPGFRISKRTWPAHHTQSHVGNIFWERYVAEAWTCAALLTWLRDARLFTTDSGHEELFTWFESGITDHAHVRRLLIDAAKEDRL
jgi:hypothetical protein